MIQECMFCRIASGTIPSARVFETDTIVAFRDTHPQAPSHVLIVPRTHVTSLLQLDGSNPTWNDLLTAVQEVVEIEGLAGGFRVVMNTGEDGGQTVAHLHLHVLGGRPMLWPPG
jgi:histidine triad (HIT) family protein